MFRTTRVLFLVLLLAAGSVGCQMDMGGAGLGDSSPYDRDGVHTYAPPRASKLIREAAAMEAMEIEQSGPRGVI